MASKVAWKGLVVFRDPSKDNSVTLVDNKASVLTAAGSAVDQETTNGAGGDAGWKWRCRGERSSDVLVLEPSSKDQRGGGAGGLPGLAVKLTLSNLKSYVKLNKYLSAWSKDEGGGVVAVLDNEGFLLVEPTRELASDKQLCYSGWLKLPTSSGDSPRETPSVSEKGDHPFPDKKNHITTVETRNVGNPAAHTTAPVPAPTPNVLPSRAPSPPARAEEKPTLPASKAVQGFLAIGNPAAKSSRKAVTPPFAPPLTSPGGFKALVPFFNPEPNHGYGDINPASGIQDPDNVLPPTGQEQGSLRVILVDSWQWFMIEDKLDEMEYNTGSRIKVLGTPEGSVPFSSGDNCGAGRVLAVSEGNPVVTLCAILDAILSDVHINRKQETHIIVDALSARKVIGKNGSTIRDITSRTGAEVVIKDVAALALDVVMPNEKVASVSGTKDSVMRAATEVCGLMYDNYNRCAAGRSPPPLFLPPRTRPDDLVVYGGADAVPDLPFVPVQPVEGGGGPSGTVFSRVLVPQMWGERMLCPPFLANLQSHSGARASLQRASCQMVPLCLFGTPRSVREAICIVFKTIVDFFFHGNLEAIRMTVQFQAEEMSPQDVFAFQGVALRTGCTQVSDWKCEEVSFKGNLYNILAAMGYMLNYYY